MVCKKCGYEHHSIRGSCFKCGAVLGKSSKETAWPMKFRLPDGRRATTFFETKADAETGKRVLAYFDIDAEIGNMVSG